MIVVRSLFCLPLVGLEVEYTDRDPERGAAIGGAPAHRLDESPAGYSSASCSPAELASASPVGRNYGATSSLKEGICSQRRSDDILRVSQLGSTPAR